MGHNNQIINNVIKLHLWLDGSNCNATLNSMVSVNVGGIENTVKKNSLTGAISVRFSSRNTICDNVVTNGSAIGLVGSSSNRVFNNTVKNCKIGVAIHLDSSDNVVYDNILLNNQIGFAIHVDGSNNAIYNNYVANSSCGINIGRYSKSGENTTLYHNNFVDNIIQVNTESRAEDYFNTNWFIKRYEELSGNKIENVKKLSELSSNNEIAHRVFQEFTLNLSEFLIPYLFKFKAEKIIIGGSISKASNLFKNILKENLLEQNLSIDIEYSESGERSNIIGAAKLFDEDYYQKQLQNFKSFQIKIPANENHSYGKLQSANWRKTKQFLLPVNKLKTNKGHYDIYPSFKIEKGKIIDGISELVTELIQFSTITIDGYIGVFWQTLVDQLLVEFSKRNIKIKIYHVDSALKNEESISVLIENDLGKEDSIFGKKTNLSLIDFFDVEKLQNIKPDKNSQINIIVGCGAKLAHWEGVLVYADLPKNELQFRMRANSICNLGANYATESKQMYKRFYFVDWIVLNEHKKNILNKIDFIVDTQRPNHLLSMTGSDFRKTLKQIAENYFRVRPWFEPGPWGGTWIKDTIKGLAEDVPNYAWSFELIVPENGIIIESDDKLLEVSFDFLMFQENEKILGKSAKTYGNEFPIRFDFLDTFNGGNLSVQCHPRLEYMKNNFGEIITQDESYYILDTKDNAKVYLGFQNKINPSEFKNDLEKSYKESKPVDVDKYVQSHVVKKHDLLLIPGGTIHGSGKNNLVLEISNTPYIFTFKMYDWLRMDLDGKPRPINIELAFNNLYFERKGEVVETEFIAKSKIISEGSDWKIVHLQTHEKHIYDVERLEFMSSINVQTDGRFHVCMLVEGQSIIVETQNGMSARFNYAETFVIPSAAKSYKFINESKKRAMVVKAFIK